MSFVKFLVILALTLVVIFGVFPGFDNSVKACPSGRPSGDLIVALRQDAVPFTDFNGAGRPTGFNVTLWNEIAETLRVPDGNGGFREPDVTFVQCDKINDQEAALIAGHVDVIISPLTITSGRMRNYDFSQQYISSGLAVAVPARSAINFDIAAKIIRKTLSSSNVAAVIIAFLTFNLVIAALIRWIVFSPDERNAGGKFGIWIRAVLEALVRTVGLRGVGKDYISAASKLLEIFMAVVGTGLSATLIGLLTSAFVGSVGNQDDINPIELTTMRVATIYCSTAQTLLRQQYKKLTKIIHLNDPQKQLVNDRVNALFCPKTSAGKEIPTIEPIEGLEGQILLVDSWSTAMALLAAGKVDAVLGDWVALTYLSRQNYEQQIEVLPSVFLNEPYGWGISRASVSEDVRRDIDRALINNLRDVAWRSKLESALGAGAVSPN